MVEDEEAVRTMLSRLLESEGYVVLQAEDGAQALDLIKRSDGGIDLVITDVAMPKMNGRELAAQLEALNPELPVLFISGYTDDEMVRRGLIEPNSPFLQQALYARGPGSQGAAPAGSVVPVPLTREPQRALAVATVVDRPHRCDAHLAVA